MRSRHVERMKRRAQLLGPDGKPIQASYAIPFVRIFPNSMRGLQTIDRGEAMYALACRFIAGGGRYGISIEADGSVALLINDGMHRLYLARLEWVVPQVTYIRGVAKAYPYYAYPRRERWEGLDLLADNPDPKAYLKKCHRVRHNKRLYRDFQAVFANVGRPRSRLLKK